MSSDWFKRYLTSKIYTLLHATLVLLVVRCPKAAEKILFEKSQKTGTLYKIAKLANKKYKLFYFTCFDVIWFVEEKKDVKNLRTVACFVRDVRWSFDIQTSVQKWAMTQVKDTCMQHACIHAVRTHSHVHARTCTGTGTSTNANMSACTNALTHNTSLVLLLVRCPKAAKKFCSKKVKKRVHCIK